MNLDEQFADFTLANGGNDELDAFHERQRKVKYHLMEI